MSATPDPGYRDYARGACGCGVPRAAAQVFHQTTDCRCRYHDPTLCVPCTEQARREAQQAADKAWCWLYRADLDDMLAKVEDRLRAEAEYGPFIVD